MIPRGKLSISFQQLFKVLAFAAFNKKVGKIYPDPLAYRNSLFCLSVRTGLDLTLRSLNFEKDSEILVTNINIPDMFTILKAHQLKCKPLSLNKHTLSLSTEQIETLITPKSKAILVTHLFGAIMPMEPIVLLAKKYNLLVIEDCAQAFNCSYQGHPDSDLVLFSFGLIKTNTCLTGAMISFADEKLLHKVMQLNAQLPKQATTEYIAKIFKALAIKIITQKWSYTLLYFWSQFIKKDFDSVLAGFTKGFPGEDVMAKIRFRPCGANLQMLQLRTKNKECSNIQKRIALARQILQKIPLANQIGNQNPDHSYWVLAVESNCPTKLINALRAMGMDATAKASSLVSKGNGNDLDELQLDKLVYLPIDKKMLNRLAFPAD